MTDIFLSYLFSVGTYKIRGKELIFSLVKTALEAGYRSFGKIIDALASYRLLAASLPLYLLASISLFLCVTVL